MNYFSKTLPYIANTKFPSTLIPYVTEKKDETELLEKFSYPEM
jgi:hypothetical protein